VGLERGPLSLVNTIEELLEIKSLENYITALGDRRADYAAPLYSQKVALALPASAGRSVVRVPSRTKTMELS
jgi:hypothetical protein